MAFWNWSQTAANNATADPNVYWAEGQAPSTVNNSARGMMQSTAQWRDDISGAIVTGGGPNAYTLSSYEGYDTLAHMDKCVISFTPNETNAAVVTLSVDGLTAKPIRQSPNVDIQAGVLIAGTPYKVLYNNSNGEFYLFDFYGNPFNVPLGAMLPYTASTAPNACFALPHGQAISRTTYAAYFSLVGTAYGSGDGSTTFNIPDMRGRLCAGWDSMGGTAANRITSAVSGIDGTTIGANGGAQSYTIGQTNLPAVSLSVSGSVSGNASGSVTLTNASQAISVTGTYTGTNNVSVSGSPSITLTGTSGTMNSNTRHTHSYTQPALGSGTGTTPNYFYSSITGGTTGSTNIDHTHNLSVSGSPSITLSNSSQAISVSGTSSGNNSISVSGTATLAYSASLASGATANMGSGTAMAMMPPAIILNFILRVL